MMKQKKKRRDTQINERKESGNTKRGKKTENKLDTKTQRHNRCATTVKKGSKLRLCEKYVRQNGNRELKHNL